MRYSNQERVTRCRTSEFSMIWNEELGRSIPYNMKILVLSLSKKANRQKQKRYTPMYATLYGTLFL